MPNNRAVPAAAWLAASMVMPAYAQQGHTMPGMDMDTMMKQCSQMRQQMRPGEPLSPQMQTMMRQCDQMDREMGSAAPAPTEAPIQAPTTSAAPRVRTR